MENPEERQMLMLPAGKDLVGNTFPSWLKIGVASLLGVAVMAVVDNIVFKPKLVVAPTEGNPFSEAIECGEHGSLDFKPVSAVDESVQKATRQSLRLLDRKRERCDFGAMQALPLQPEEFIGGTPKNSPKKLAAFHKFSPNCDMETFKLHFEVGATPVHTSFVVHVFHTIEDDRWEILKSSPAACEISLGAEALPETHRADSVFVKDSASFAVSELSFGAKEKGCLQSDSPLKLKEIVAAQTRILQGVHVRLLLLVQEVPADGVESGAVSVEVIVMHVCGETEDRGCVNELALPDHAEQSSDICTLLNKAYPKNETQKTMSERRLQEFRRFGHVDPDPTDVKLDLLRNLMASDSPFLRPPIAVRRLPGTIEIPNGHDVREDEEACDKYIQVMSQGDCGSCYAHAFAYMVGSRTCRVERKRRRLTEAICSDATLVGGTHWIGDATGMPNTILVAEISLTKDSSRTAERHVGTVQNHQHLPRLPNHRRMGSQNSQTNRRQQTGCPTSQTQENLPNVEMSEGFETKVLQNRETDLITLGKACKPYNLKCWNVPEMVSNSYLRYSSCSDYLSTELWSRPCRCISNYLRPTEYICDLAEPSPECGVTPPFALFQVKSVESGLSREESVQNIQRHILEFGPVYASMIVTSTFLSWDFSNKPVFTDTTGDRLGGHAVALAGWGTMQDHDFWLVRQSWGPAWGDQGHFKMLRGQNMLGVEENIYASMPTALYEEHSDINCEVVEALRSYSLSKHKLESYTWLGRFRCSAPANLVVWIARSDGKSVEHIDTQQVGRGAIATVSIKLHCEGYGLKEGTMDLVIGGKDPKTGQSTENWQSVLVPPVPGAESLNREWC